MKLQKTKPHRREALQRVFHCSMLVLGMCIAGTDRSVAEDFVTGEPAIKAAYLYNFAKYIRLSDRARSKIPGDKQTVTVGVVGETPVTEHLQKISQKKTVNGKQLKVTLFRQADEIAPCHVIYIPSTVDEKIRDHAVQRAQEMQCVEVTDDAKLAATATIVFIHVANRVHFEVNMSQIKSMNLTASSKLLQIGTLVRREPK